MSGDGAFVEFHLVVPDWMENSNRWRAMMTADGNYGAIVRCPTCGESIEVEGSRITHFGFVQDDVGCACGWRGKVRLIGWK